MSQMHTARNVKVNTLNIIT